MKKQKIKDFNPDAMFYTQVVNEHGIPISDASWSDLCDNTINIKNYNSVKTKAVDLRKLKSNFDAFFTSISPNKSIYPFQSTLISEVENNKNNLFVKARQLGVTEVLCRYIVWKMIFNPNTCINYISYTYDMSKMIKNRITTIFNSLPNEFHSFKYLSIDESNITCNINDSKVLLSTAQDNGDNIRGIRSVNICIIDESSYIPPEKLKNIITASQVNTHKFIFTYSVISDSSCLDVIEESISPLNVNVYRWYLSPEHKDDNWKNRYIRNVGENAFQMEQECKLSESDDL